MNLKERGLTVGDLLLILIFVVSTVLVINKYKESNEQAYLNVSPNYILDAKKY